MKKVIFALACIAGLATTAKADVKGWTKPRNNSTGGITYVCDPDPDKVCTSSTRNPNGTLTVLIRNYDSQGNLTGTTTVVFPSVDSTEPNIEEGLIYEVPTEYGVLWGKAID